ncbi:MAG: polymerase-3 subunit gamma/tau [Hydrocarboniphaga sp.]|uniref:BcsR/BcsP family cellulose biosynthesis protein n=1 Tax=Hydrocarboniphaga sp. TaxID=2033016 RepID=UPI0026395BED|nr:BcsR/BcsP family cellulose biosynthesis protein [Hydrocarboniphaga sp.]MDB5970703.1 polymerase-3 subunit gamma/tau [Hydrocarboniphaga sp.]
MADRSDDIKQLFSHLGLNPGDYQELREKTRAATRGGSLMPPTVAPTTLAAATVQLPPTVPAAVPMPPPIAPTTIAPPPVRLQAPTVTPVAAAATDLSTRWSLLRAAVETPTRVAQIERSQAPIAPVEMPIPVISEDQPTRRLFMELSRRPVAEAVDQLTEAARRRWREPVAPAEPMRPPAAAPVSAEAPQAPAPGAPTFADAGPSAEVPASGELLSTFRRLVAPERVAQQKPAHLHFNYSADSIAPRAMQAREENLGDVFSRISDPRPPR